MPMSPRLLRPRAAVSTAFDPRSISGLAVWLDASDSTTITLNGSNVSEWRDKSGNSRHATQSTALNQPAFTNSGVGGKPSVSLTSTSQFINVPLSIPSGGDYSIFAAARLDTLGGPSNTQRLVSSFGDAGLFFGSLNNAFAVFVGNGAVWSAVAANTPTRAVLNTNRVLSMIRSGSSQSPFVDGEAQTAKSSSLTAAMASMTIGWNQANQVWLGPVGEVLVVTRAVSSGERQSIERYLGARWGITVA